MKNEKREPYIHKRRKEKKKTEPCIVNYKKKKKGCDYL